MSIFTRPISELDTSDLQELLSEAAIENARLEFKLEVPGKDETLKKLSSFANTFGGFMVIGAKATSADGRVEELSGVDPQAGYKQKIVQWCFDGANPPLTVQVSDPIPVPAGNGKVCYVLHTAESDVAPHFLNGRKGVYVRTDEFSARFEARMADDRELRHLFDRRKVVQERRASLLDRARRRFTTYASRRHEEVNGKTGKLGARLDLCIVPRFPSLPLCEQDALERLVLKNTMHWRGTSFPRLGNIVSQHESVVFLQAAEEFSIFEANIWGMLFYGTEIAVNDKDVSGIHLNHFLGCILVFLRQAAEMLKALGYAGPLVIQTALSSILGVDWLYFHHGRFPRSKAGSELDDDVEFPIITTSDALIEKPDRVAMDVLRSVFAATNWAEMVDTPDKRERLVRAGYSFNMWSEPATVQK